MLAVLCCFLSTLLLSPCLVSAMSRRLVARASSSIDNAGCQGTLDLNGFSKLNKICEDCYSLYKAPEVYTLCREDCFGTRFFDGCMDTLLVKDELKSEVAAYLDDVHSSYYNPLHKWWWNLKKMSHGKNLLVIFCFTIKILIIILLLCADHLPFSHVGLSVNKYNPSRL